MKAVIPAAGRGSRLGRLTERTPKALVEVGGVPALRRILQAVAPHVDEAVVVVGWLADRIVTAVPDWHPEVPVTFVTQPDPDGTADAILRAREVVGDDRFLYSWGDVLTPPGLIGEILGRVRADLGVIAVDRVEDMAGGADVRIERGSVVSIHEKPPIGSGPGWNATGVGCLPADAWDMLAVVPVSGRGEHELTHVLGRLAVESRLVAVEAGGPAFDIGTPGRLAAADRHYR